MDFTEAENNQPAANRFQELFSETSSDAEYTEADWEMETSVDLPESVVYDPEWAELDAEGVTYRDAVRYAMPEYAEYEDDEIDEAVENITGEMSEAEIEGFFSGLKRIARGALKIAAPIIRDCRAR